MAWLAKVTTGLFVGLVGGLAFAAVYALVTGRFHSGMTPGEWAYLVGRGTPIAVIAALAVIFTKPSEK